MSVIVMLYWIWEGLCGFIAVICGLLAVYTSFGPTGRAIILILLSWLGIYMMDQHKNAEKRAASHFLAAWVESSSVDHQDRRANTRGMWEFMDFNRIRNFDGNFPTQFRLLRNTPVREAGQETILTDRDPNPVKTKVFLSRVRMHSQEGNVDYNAVLRIWVAMDSDEVARFQFEDVVFQ